MFRMSRVVLVGALCAMPALWLSGCTSRVEEKAPPAGDQEKGLLSDAKLADAKEEVPAGEAKPAAVKQALWQTDFERAKAEAKAEKKMLLVDFTGSDWCGWCIKLNEEVFDTEAFKTEAPKQFVCVEVDFPQNKEIPKQLKEQNAELANQYKVSGFPAILVMDPEGEVIARTGYRPGGPEAYLKHLDDFVKTHEQVVAIRPQLEKAEGLDRAKLLDQLIDAYEKLGTESDDIAKWSEEIVQLDSENKTGLKPKYEFRVLMAEAGKLMSEKKFDEAKAAFDKALAVSSITPEQRQNACIAQGEAFFRLNDFAGLVACLKKAHEADPESPRSKQVQQMLERFEEIGAMQEAVAKIKADLEKAEGLDRAKLLDQLVDALDQLNNSPVGGVPPEELAKLSEEIVALDANNEAGLKQKHTVRTALAKVASLSAEGNSVEAGDLVDTVLATPDLSPEQRQELQSARGKCYLMAGEAQKGLECLEKALEAAPEGSLAPTLTDMIRFCKEKIEKEERKTGQQPNEDSESAKPSQP